MTRTFVLAGVLALLIGGEALAADLPQPAPPPPRAPATYVPAQAPYFSWTGIYIGLNGGGAFGQSNWTDPTLPPTGNFNVNGFLVGGTVGANYQMGSFVIGIEADGDWANFDGTTPCGITVCETKSDWLATVRGRAGWAMDRVLFYGTGGAAFGNVQAAAGVLPFNSTTQVGWTAGAGIEYAFTPNWTAKVEYLFVDLQNAGCAPASCAGPATTVSLNENIVRAGVNFKFW
jgi:outer membrane immunogenic protein